MIPSAQHLLDLILPSLESLGLWSYWLIGLASLLEAFFVTGIVLPGSLVVDMGGVLVHRGALDFIDLAWFVAIGSLIGSELSFRLGQFGRNRHIARLDPQKSPAFRRATALFERHGALAILLGRFSGPVAGIMPFVAALSGMEHRRFLMWSAIGAVPYALVHLAIGYGLGEVLNRMGPLTTRIALALAAAAVLLAMLWYIVNRIFRSLPFLRSVLSSAFEGALRDPHVVNWAGRHPTLSGFIARRFDPTHFVGRPLTLMAIAMSYVVAVYIGSVLDLLRDNQVVQADTRLASLIHAFQTPGAIRVAAHVTALGDWRVVAALMVGLLAWLALRGQKALVLGLATAVAGDLVTVPLLKAAFARPRPEFAYFVETSGSFPSGHAAISVAFYGFAAYALWRTGVLRPAVAALAVVTLAFAIGLSRIYLIEHYLSDVLNGYLVGVLWLLAGVAVAELMAMGATVRPRAPNWAAALPLAIAIMAAGWFTATYDKARSIPFGPPPTEMVAQVQPLFSNGQASSVTETLLGTPQEPINIVLIAQDRATLGAAMTRAGWDEAVSPRVGPLVQAALLAWTNQPDPTAPVTPYFWEGNPNDLAYQRPDAADTLRRRHHVRLWETRFATSDGRQVFVGSASFDDGLKWGLTHHISPDLDAERARLVDDLMASTPGATAQPFQITSVRTGQDLFGDPWFTDGKAVLVTLP